MISRPFGLTDLAGGPRLGILVPAFADGQMARRGPSVSVMRRWNAGGSRLVIGRTCCRSGDVRFFTMIRTTVTVEKPVEEVFDYAAQFDRHPEWQDNLKGATANGPPALGATGTATRQMGPRLQTSQWRMSAYERPRVLGWEILSGPMRPAGTMRFSAEGTSTRVDFEMALNPRGLMKLMNPIIDRQGQKIATGHLAKFKDILEHPR